MKIKLNIYMDALKARPQRPSLLIHGLIQLTQWISELGVWAFVKLVISGVNSELVSRGILVSFLDNDRNLLGVRTSRDLIY